MKKILLLVLVLFQNTIFAQKCGNKEENLSIDMSSITKCAIQDWTDDKGNSMSGRNKQISIEISPRRYFKRLRKRQTKSSINTNTSKISDLNVNEKIDNSIISNKSTATKEIAFNFDIIQKAATFKECEGKSTSCFIKRLGKHVKKSFYYPKEALRKGIEGKVLVQFIVNKNGEIDLSKIRARGPRGGEVLTIEAKRIISDLPSFLPGEHNGSKVNVKYVVPISFKLPKNSSKNRIEEVILKDVISFANVEEVPLFSSCESVDKDKQSNCFNNQMMQHIQKNFNYPKYAVENQIEGKVWVKFVINKKGQVKNIKLRNGAPILKSEAERLIAKLPSFKPGKQNGKAANVSYVLPINFKLGR